jgi:predicted transcriptional regulator/transcriptional regulator with XRE-family HTH domain
MTQHGNPRMGSKIRAMRRREGLTQAELAKRLGISASYLNLIENDRRPLTAPLLIKVASLFDVDVTAFAADEDARLISDLMEVFGDPVFDEESLTNADVRELVTSSPGVARAVRHLYRSFQGARQKVQTLAGRISDDDDDGVSVEPPTLPSEQVSDLLQRHNNHFPALEQAAEALWKDARLDEEHIFEGLGRYLDERLGIRVRLVRAHDGGSRTLRRYDPDNRELLLSEVLPPRSRHFQMAHQLALLAHHDELERVSSDRELTTDESRSLCHVALASYFASAVLMPYEPFRRAAAEARYDLELLGHRFRTSWEQVCHRVTTLGRPGDEGIPFHLVRVDVAGNISKRFSGSGIRFARFSGACPRWNVFGAFQMHGQIRTQISEMPEGDAYLCMARTVRTTVGGYRSQGALYAVGVGCKIEHAGDVVYADGMNIESKKSLVPVGVTCRLCERMDCSQRAFPPLHSNLAVDENVRGMSFYAPPNAKSDRR